MIRLHIKYSQLVNKKSSKVKLFVTYLLVTIIILSQFYLLATPIEAGKSKKINGPIGAEKLADPDYYEPGIVPGGLDSDNTAVTPTRVETFSQFFSGFSVSSSQFTDIQDITFRVIFPDGSYSNYYALEKTDTESDSDIHSTFTSNLYLFNNGISAVEFYYNGLKNFTVDTYSYDQLKSLYPPQKFSTDLASPPAEIEYKEKLFNSLGFNIITREEWGAPTDSIWQPVVVKVNRIVVHHTATGVDMSDPSNTVRAIYQYHSVTLDWGDIGYNYLIDPYGNLYEGRAGGNGVIGAHAIPNSGSIGIAILGNYQTQSPTQASLDTLTRLLAALSNLNDFSLNVGTSLLGHRDVNPTACPGELLYNKLPELQAAAENLKIQRSKVKDAVTQANSMITNEYAQENNIAQILVDLTNVNDNMKEKLLSTSRGAVKTHEIASTGIIFVDNNRVKEYIAETLLSVPESHIQPNYVYHASGWNNSDPNRSIPSDFDSNIHWYLEKTNVPETWKKLGGCISGNNCGGSNAIRVAIVDTGVAYEDYDYDTGSQFETITMGGITMEKPLNSTPNGQFNEGLDRKYEAAPELSHLFPTNIIHPRDVGQDYLCTLRLIFGNPCTDEERNKIEHANDDQGHGTLVSTIIAGRTADAAPNKIVGIAHNVSIIPVKVFLPNDNSLGVYKATSNSLLVNWGIKWAVDHGAKVVNLSLIGPAPDIWVEDAVNYAYNLNVTIVAAAGNDNNEIRFYSPANLSKVLTVGSANFNNSKANYSNFVPELDLVAPVGDYASQPNQQLVSQSYMCVDCSNETSGDLYTQFTSQSSPPSNVGTSFAAPQVSAAVALALSVKPSLNPLQVYNLIIGRTTRLNANLVDYNTGYGLLNIEELVKYLADTVNAVSNPNSNPSANGDNKSDIITFNTTSMVADVTPSSDTNFGGGYGGFQVWNSYTFYNPANWTLLKPADADGDGNLDLIAFNKTNLKIAVTLSYGNSFGRGSGNFQIWNSYSFYDPSKWQLLNPADVNGDGKADIIAFNIYTTAIDVTLSNGLSFGGGYGGYQVWNSTSYYNPAKWKLLDPADVNDDEKADIIAFNVNTTAIDVTLSTGTNFGGGNGGFQVWNSNSNYNPSSWQILNPADVNNDEKADIIAFNVNTTAISVILSTGGNFGGGNGGQQVWNSFSFYSPAKWKLLDPTDVNGDGKADIIAFNFYTTAIDVTLSTGTNFGGGYGGYQVWNSYSFYDPGKWTLLN